MNYEALTGALTMTPARRRLNGDGIAADDDGSLQPTPVHAWANDTIDAYGAVGVGAQARPEPPRRREEDMTYVWGTGIAMEEFKSTFQHHLETYLAHPRDTCPFYLRELHRMRLRESSDLEVDMTSLWKAEPKLFHQTVGNPSECLPMMGSVAESVYRTMFPEAPEDFSVNICARKLPTTLSLRELSPSHIETLISVRGMIVRTSKIIPEVRVAHFVCWACEHAERSVVERGRIFEPVRCGHCGKNYTYRLQHNLSIYEDKQLIRLQEAPENLADGDTPVTISLVVYSELVDSVVPGDRICATGIFRSCPVKLNSNTRIIKSVFSTHIDAIHLDKKGGGNKRTPADKPKGAEGEDTVGEGGKSMLGGAVEAAEEFDMSNKKKIDAFRQISQRPDFYDIILRSFAPTIWGHDDVKRGILCQMFGGSRKEFRHGKFRSEINIILCGDPGVAKSQLLTQVHEISPRGVYTSGKGSSSVGLTAFVVKDSDTNEFVLEPGALVLSDRGVCCIDEFDKMNEATRSVLHEVMEQQTMSIAKAGIVAQLNARTSILAAANPAESQWNPTMNIVENLQIEPTLLSRFDLIFLLLDRHDEQMDRFLAAHVLALYMDQKSAAAASAAASPPVLEVEGETLLASSPSGPVIPQRIFSQYLYYAKEVCCPQLSDASQSQLSSAYVELRRVRGGGKTVSATLRQLESMLRLSEARCKMRLGTTVSVEDVLEAKRLISSALKEAATDPKTGLINMDIFTAPDPGRNNMENYLSKLERIIERKYLVAQRKSCSVHELRQALNESLSGAKPIAPQQFLEVLALMSGGDYVSSFTSAMVTFGNGI